MVEQSIRRDVLWLFREYENVQDFVSQTETASLVIGGLGFIIGILGFSGTIPSAVGALGIASAVNEIILRVYYNEKHVWDNINNNRKVVSSLINLAVGFVIYMILVDGAHLAPSLTTLHFGLGIVIWFLAGSVYMRTHTTVKEGAHQATKIIIPTLVTIGFLMWLLILMPTIGETFLGAEIFEMLEQSPEDVTNQTGLNMTGL